MLSVAAARHHRWKVPIIRCLDWRWLALELLSASPLRSCVEHGGPERMLISAARSSRSHWTHSGLCRRQRFSTACPASGLMWWNGPASSSKLLYRGEYFLCAFYRISNSSSKHLLAKLSACCTQAQKAQVQIAVATLSGNSLRQTVHTHRASVHQAAKLVAALLRVAGVTAGLGRK